MNAKNADKGNDLSALPVVYSAMAATVLFILFVRFPSLLPMWLIILFLMPVLVSEVLKKKVSPLPGKSKKYCVILAVILIAGLAFTILSPVGGDFGFTVRTLLFCFNTILGISVSRLFAVPFRWGMPLAVLSISCSSSGPSGDILPVPCRQKHP